MTAFKEVKQMIDISTLSAHYEVRRMTDADADDLLRFCQENTMYYEYCSAEPSKAQVMSDLHITPPGVQPSDKYYLGFFRDGQLVAVMDLIDGYPDPETAFIGFFMMNAALQGKQIGSAIVQDVFRSLKKSEKTAVRLAIAEENPQANHFWKKNGFCVIGKVPMDGWNALVAEKKL